MSIDLPNYRIVEKLGIGARSGIYRARCMRTGKDYAVKIVKIRTPEDMGFVDLLKTEYAIGRSIDHPVLRDIYELRMLRRRLRVKGAILFMEYVHGVAMSDGEFKRPIDEVLGLFGQVAQGLAAMHAAGHVHADLKPGNIMVTPDGHAKLIDFGQSCNINQAKQRIQGSIHYIAPEQVRLRKLDQRTDVFGLAATLYRTLTGKNVATEMNQTANPYAESLIGKRLERNDDEAAALLPGPVARLIDDCCAKNPDDRVADMAEFVTRIEMAKAALNSRSNTSLLDDDDYEDDDYEDDLPADPGPDLARHPDAQGGPG